MKHRVFGKITEDKYEVVNCKKSVRENGVINEVFTGKPYLRKNTEVVETPEILTFESQNYDASCYGTLFSTVRFNISEKESVHVRDVVFRADLAEMHMFTDKIVEERPGNKEEAEAALDKLVKEFNKTMIKSNDKLRAYCDIHHLSYANTDCIELFKLVYPGREWRIIDGKLFEVIDVAADCLVSEGTYSQSIKTAIASSECANNGILGSDFYKYTELRPYSNTTIACSVR